MYGLLSLDSVLAFKKRMKLGRFANKDPEALAQAAAQEESEKLLSESISIGARCQVTFGAQPKRGVVMFVGMCINLKVTCVYCITSLHHHDEMITPFALGKSLCALNWSSSIYK